MATGRQQLRKELELTRLLKQSKHSKSAIESMLAPAQIKLSKLQKRVVAIRDIKAGDGLSTSSDEGQIEDLVKQCSVQNHTDCHLLLGLMHNRVTEGMFERTLQQRLATAE